LQSRVEKLPRTTTCSHQQGQKVIRKRQDHCPASAAKFCKAPTPSQTSRCPASCRGGSSTRKTQPPLGPGSALAAARLPHSRAASAAARMVRRGPRARQMGAVVFRPSL
jgi:hypothetical protein